MLPLLAVDTTSRSSSVCLQTKNKKICKDDTSSKGVEGLLPLIHSCLSEANLEVGDIKTVCSSIGPGSFTGIRTGLAVALGLGLGANCQVVGVPLLAARVLASICKPGQYTGFMLASKIDYFLASYSLDEAGGLFELEGVRIAAKSEIVDKGSKWLNLDDFSGSGAASLADCAQTAGDFGLESPQSSELKGFEPVYAKPVNAKTLVQRQLAKRDI